MFSKIGMIVFFAAFALNYFVGFRNAELVEAVGAAVAAIGLILGA